MSLKTAILIFANSPEIDARQKNILNGDKLFIELNTSLIQKVKKTNVPYVIISEKEQKGLNFGERFFHAFQELFNQGFDHVIAIGNDTPQLTSQHLLDTQNNLKLGKTSIGPSVDGGFYLLGINKKTFSKLDFKHLAWQTPRLFHQLKSALIYLNEDIICLKRFLDIDDLEDLKSFKNFTRHISSGLHQLISILLKQFSHIYRYKNLSKFGVASHIPFNKGSPKVKFDFLS